MNTKNGINDTISLCMIVKDEAQHIERCLKSVEGVVDEIVVVDTGSSDDTVKRAERMGANVYHYKWQDSFAAARNKALHHATKQWILHLDADEELAAGDGPPLRELVRDEVVEAYYLIVEDARTHVSNGSIRLFRRNAKYKYKGVIHEIITFPWFHEASDKMSGADVRIIHHGYQLDKHQMANKHFRNIELLKRSHKKDPTDPRTNYFLGEIEDKRGSLEEAVKYYDAAFRNDRRKESPYINRNLAMTLEHLGRYDEAFQYIDDGLKNYPQYTDLYYINGLLFLRKGDYSKAADNFSKAVQLGPAPPIFPTYPETGGRFAKRELATCYVQLGRLREARDLYVEVLAEDPGDTYALKPLAHLLIGHHDKDKVRKELEKLANMKNEQVQKVMREIFGE